MEAVRPKRKGKTRKKKTERTADVEEVLSATVPEIEATPPAEKEVEEMQGHKDGVPSSKQEDTDHDPEQDNTEHGSRLEGTEHGSRLEGTEHGSRLEGTEHGSRLEGTEHGSTLEGTEHGSRLEGTEHASRLEGTEHGSMLEGTEHVEAKNDPKYPDKVEACNGHLPLPQGTYGSTILGQINENLDTHEIHAVGRVSDPIPRELDDPAVVNRTTPLMSDERTTGGHIASEPAEAAVLLTPSNATTLPTQVLTPLEGAVETSGPGLVGPGQNQVGPITMLDSGVPSVLEERTTSNTVTGSTVQQNHVVMATTLMDVVATEHLSSLAAAPIIPFQAADIRLQSPLEEAGASIVHPVVVTDDGRAAERQASVAPAAVPTAPLLSSGAEQAGMTLEANQHTGGVAEMAPFTEQELAAFYQNSQLEANATFVDNFILQCKQEHHPLYLLLLQYLKANLALTTSKKAVEGYQKDFRTNQPLIWTILQKDVTSSGKCADNTKVSHTHVYNYAVFNPDATIRTNTALKSLRETLQEDLCMRSYSSQLARIHVVNFLHRLVQTTPDILHVDPNSLNVTGWIPLCVPGQTDRSSAVLRDCISVLFMFQRRPPQDQQFSVDCMMWLDILLSILLRIATLSDHQFIFNHLLRCPPGVGRWGAKYLQISSPLHTDLYLAPFKHRALDAYTRGEQDVYAREWGVGQGLHQDWGGPLLDHFVNMLATLLLPVKQREEFMCLLAIPPSEQMDESQTWTFIDDSLEENETAQQQLLLKESDLMAFFDQFPFGDMYQHIMQIRDGEVYAEHCSSYSMLRLIAFCTCLIRLLGAAFATIKLMRYKEFIKRVGRTIRQTVAYVGDHWLGYKSHRILCGDSMDCMPQGPREDYYRYSLSRLQLEFDQFVLRATQWILTAHKLGAWQFLADLPYASVSLHAVWRMFWCLYNTPKNGSAPTLVPGTSTTGGLLVPQDEVPSNVEQIIEALRAPLLKDQFLDCLMTAYTSEAIFLLTTFANMARARPSTSEEEKLFINTIAMELFQCTQVAAFAKDAYSHTGRSLLGSIAIVHPFVVTTLMDRTDEAFRSSPENCLQLYKELPLSLWQPGSHNLHIIHGWLVQHPPSSIQNKVARVILSGLNWGSKVEDGSNELVLDVSTHRFVAILLVEAHTQHLPTHPGGRQYTPVQGIRKYASSFISGMPQEQAEFLSWAWEVALMLKLHPNQLSSCTASLLSPTPSAPEQGTPAGGAEPLKLRSAAPGGQVPSPDSWVLPPLTGAEELADIRDAVKYNGHLAYYVALSMTSVGSDTDEFLSIGLKMLDTLIEEGYYLPVLRIIANITPRFFQQKKPLLVDPMFLQVVMALASADAANVSLREKLTFTLPQPLVSRKMAALIVTQLQTACGPGGVGGETVLQFWLDTFLSFPNWWKEQSLLYLMDVVAQFVFTDVSLLKHMQKALLESYFIVQSGSTRRTSFMTTVLSAVVSEGPPSIFNSVPVSSFPWLAFCALCAEEQYEMEEGIWKALLLLLKNDSRITLDAALKRVLTDLKTQLFPVSHLSIYRWAEFCAAVDMKEPVAVLAWQKFFMLYLQRPILQGNMPERDSQGWKFFSTSTGTSLKRRLKTSLSSACSTLKSSLTALEQRADDGQEPVDQSSVILLTSYLKYYQTLRLWLDEPRLHDSTLYIPGLPSSYEPSRLECLVRTEKVPLWFELVPFDEVKGQLNALVQEWMHVAAYQKTLPFKPESSGSQVDSAFTRIQKRLLKCSKPALAPPPLQIIPAPFVTVPDDVLTSPDAFLSVLSTDLHFIVSNARSFITNANLLASLDNEYIAAVPELYSNPTRQFHVQVACHRAQQRGQICIGPATLIFRVEEMALHPKWDHRLRMNRGQYDQTLVAMTTPVAYDMCMAVMRMEHNVARLVQLAHQMQGSSVNMALRCGVSVFYEVLKYINLEARLYPPTCQFFTTCVQVLGQEFIHNDPGEMVNILPTLQAQPALADLLSPLFHPNRCDQSFLSMYGTIIDVARSVGISTAFSLLTKFHIPSWVDSHELSLAEGNQLMEYIVQGLVFCGPDPSFSGNGKDLLVETYRQHFKIVLNHNFPQQYSAALRLLIDCADQHSVIPNIWVDLCSSLEAAPQQQQGCRLSLQQLHDTLEFVTNHYLRRRVGEGKTLYSIVHWDYIPVITEFLQRVCSCMLAGWKDSVESSAVKADEALSKCWEAIRNTFEPWITSLDVHRQDVLYPCTELECVMMNSVMALFLNCIAALHTTLTGGTIVLAYIWQYYCDHLIINNVPEYVLVVYHTNLVKLPWKCFVPDLSVLDQMAKLKTEDLFVSSCFVFLAKIFPCLDWKHIVSTYCVMGHRGDVNPPVQLHIRLLQLLVMFASEREVMDDAQSGIPELMKDAYEFRWEFLDSKSYYDIIEWQKRHCDPIMVLQPGSNLSAALRLLKAAAGFPLVTGSKNPPTLDSWKKRHLYVQVIVELIANVTRKPDAQNFNYSAALTPLFETVIDICTYDCSENCSENVITLTGEILNLLNVCSPVPSVVQKLVDLISVILDELHSVYLIALPIVTAGCRSLASLVIMAKIVEHAIECHFRAQPRPPVDTLRLSKDSAQYGWQRVAASLVLPDSSLHEFLQICVSEFSVLILHTYILQKLYSGRSPQQEMEVAIQVVQWCTQVKPKSKEEAKLFLLWEKAINILLIQARTSYPIVVPYLSSLATVLSRSGEDKATEGILGVIGLGKKSLHSYQFRIVARAMAAFLFCQMPVDSSQTTQLRLQPEALGHIKDIPRNPATVAIVPTKMGEQSYSSLEQLLSNKQYTAWKEVAAYSVSFINDANNTLVNAVDLLVHLCTAMFPDHRYLDVLRTVAM